MHYNISVKPLAGPVGPAWGINREHAQRRVHRIIEFRPALLRPARPSAAYRLSGGGGSGGENSLAQRLAEPGSWAWYGIEQSQMSAL